MSFLAKESAEMSRSAVSRIFLLAAVFAGSIGCTPAFEGEYSDPNKAEIIDDKWNETDARKTADILVRACLEKPWLGGYTKSHKGERPVVIVDNVENATDEHIDTKALTDFIQDELINSGKVRFIDKGRRQKVLDEIKFQQSGVVNDKTKKKTGNQIGSDFMVGGRISSQVHTQEGRKTVTYQTVLTLTNIETGEIEFSDKHLIKKSFKRSGANW